MPRIYCPSCNQYYDVESNIIGQKVCCAVCNHKFIAQMNEPITLQMKDELKIRQRSQLTIMQRNRILNKAKTIMNLMSGLL